VLGLALHPYSPLTLETFFTYLQVFRIGLAGTQGSGFELGNEIYPYPPRVFFDIYPLVVLAVPVLLAAVALGWRRLTPEAKGMTAACLLWTTLTTLSARFVEYQVLLLALALALVARDLWRAWPTPSAWLVGAAWRRWAAALVAAGLLLGFHARAMTFYAVYQTVAAPPRFFDGAAAWMEKNLAPGETVINLFWDDFPDLFYSAPRQRYLWGLDPTYSLRFDEAKARLLEETRRHFVPVDGGKLRDTFQSRTLVLRTARAGRYLELRFAPFREVFRDAGAVVYRIDPAPPAPPEGVSAPRRGR